MWGGRTGALLLVSGLWSTGVPGEDCKLQCCVPGREQPSTMLELRRPGGPIAGHGLLCTQCLTLQLPDPTRDDVSLTDRTAPSESTLFLQPEVSAKQKELTDEVSRAFERDDFEKAKELLTKMRYFSNAEEKIKLKKIPL
ncbi:hypothetical protein Celaphus_00014635 [Cervus elaphus hippelaphus]|uniref:Co-chaperone HscB C-terminal oligomerisation domain-containing protein n=1 Tax=Cervus elaphus hippelaphus TaxID=46360 RepID=A0A212D4F4_CEREH|nr:hypothetical protein Celaphus_00014635 [Cervus elaphus hippelaphus]